MKASEQLQTHPYRTHPKNNNVYGYGSTWVADGINSVLKIQGWGTTFFYWTGTIDSSGEYVFGDRKELEMDVSTDIFHTPLFTSYPSYSSELK